MVDSDTTVSANVRVYMALRGEAHDDLAAALGVSRPAVSARLNGRTAWSLDDLDKLAQHYGVTPATFLAEPAAVLTELRRAGGLLDPLGRRRRRPGRPAGGGGGAQAETSGQLAAAGRR